MLYFYLSDSICPLHTYNKRVSPADYCIRRADLCLFYARPSRKRQGMKVAASYSPTLHCSTIGAGGLNFSVRNGKRWDPAAITT